MDGVFYLKIKIKQSYVIIVLMSLKNIITQKIKLNNLLKKI